jgi:nitrate/nitrite-specific signal transduction histidine kinase
MKKTSIVLLLTIMCFCEAFSQNMTIGQAVNIAGRQRMLTQRMAKARLYRTMSINVDICQKELSSSMTIFEETLKNLVAYSPNPKVKIRFAKVETLWPEYKAALSNDTSANAAFSIISQNTKILTACDEAVQELVSYSKTIAAEGDDSAISPEAIANNVNIAGRMRMLSQRLTLYYGAHYSNLDKEAMKTILLVSSNIQQGVSFLMMSDINTTDIDDAISNSFNY